MHKPKPGAYCNGGYGFIDNFIKLYVDLTPEEKGFWTTWPYIAGIWSNLFYQANSNVHV